MKSMSFLEKNMGDINYDVLCEMIAQELPENASVKSVKRYLKATYKVILKQLKLKNRIYFKGFGYWEIKERKSGEREINDPNNGGSRLVYVKPRYSIFFKASKNFDIAVNENNFNITTDKFVKKIENKRDNVTYIDLINRSNKRKKERESKNG